jgi:hypothetical protein
MIDPTDPSGNDNWEVSCFLRVGNDAIQPLEKSASKLLIRNGRNFGACGLQIFDGGWGREKNGHERAEGDLERVGQAAGFADSRSNISLAMGMSFCNSNPENLANPYIRIGYLAGVDPMYGLLPPGYLG